MAQSHEKPRPLATAANSALASAFSLELPSPPESQPLADGSFSAPGLSTGKKDPTKTLLHEYSARFAWLAKTVSLHRGPNIHKMYMAIAFNGDSKKISAHYHASYGTTSGM